MEGSFAEQAGPGRARAPDGAGAAAFTVRTTRSTAATVGGQALRTALSLGAMGVLARALTPADFGLVGMVAGALVLASEARDLGIGLAAVQRPQLSQADLSALFWIGVLASALVWLAVALSAPLLAVALGEPRAAAVAVWLATGFAIGGAAGVHRALLARRLALPRLVATEVAAALLATGLGIALALGGAGYWALVAIAVASEGLGALGAVAVCRWRPGRPRLTPPVRAALRFAGHLTLAQAVPLAVRRLDRVLIGAFVGAAPLGLYGRAHQLVTLPVQQLGAPVSRVAVPAFARLHDDPARLRAAYLESLRWLAWIGLPGLAALAVLAPDAVRLLLGPPWVGAAPLLRVLAVAGAAQLVGHSAGWLLVARGRGRPLMGWGLASSAAHAVAFAAGLPWGALGVAVAHAAVAVALRVPHLWIAIAGSEIRTAEVGRALAPPLALAAAVALACAGAHTALAGHALAARLSGALLAGVACWGAASAASSAARTAARDALRHLGAALPAPAPAAATAAARSAP